MRLSVELVGLCPIYYFGCVTKTELILVHAMLRNSGSVLTASAIVGRADDTLPYIFQAGLLQNKTGYPARRPDIVTTSRVVNRGRPDSRKSELLGLPSCHHLKGLANHMRRQV